ncbi:MAG TPA: F0F1 ATP synthase subunit A [Ktedonobacterales bacterium]|nr:F0F1 ATP synthase subunit A [Ktedonobacterales bacterium]
MLWKLPFINVPVEPLFTVGPFNFTSTLMLAIVDAIIIFLMFFLYSRRKKVLPGRIQNALEWLVQVFLNLCEEVAGKRKGRVFFPWVFGIFLYVLMGNLWEIIPGIESIGTIDRHLEGCQNVTTSLGFLLLDKNSSNCIVPWLRPPSTDLNFTLAIAVVSVVVTQIYGWRMLGAKAQLGRYISLREGVLGLFVGLLEAVLEVARIISFGFRLFGNLFAGDALLLVMGFLLPFVGAIPFYFLEIFVGVIQAFVFAMLTLIFMELGTTGHGHTDAEEEHAAEVQHEKQLRAEHALER